MILTKEADAKANIRLLEETGFVNSRTDKITETESARSAMLFAPSGFGITLTQHIKK